MDFDLEKDFEIFNELLERRPEISRESLKEDLGRYYLPYVEKLVGLKKQKSDGEQSSPSDKGLIVGVSAIQGAGKTTQGEILEVLLKHLGFSSVSRSIDDHYVTHKELCKIREKDPRFIRRGVTHDIPLAIRDLNDLQNMEERPVLVSGYDKGVQDGDGDRLRWVVPEENLELRVKSVEKELVVNKQLQKVKALSLVSVSYKGQEVSLPENMGSDLPIVEHFLPKGLVEFLLKQNGEVLVINQDEMVRFSGNLEILVPKKDLPNGWRVVFKKPDFIFYDGWMLGVRKVEDESVFDSNLPALETEEAKQFAKDVNKKLMEYEALWEMIEFMNVLYVPNYEISLKWRDQAEEALRAKGEGMSSEEIKEFVHYFWRSVHPAIHIKNLAHDRIHTQQVVIINNDHSVGDILRPEEVVL